MNSEYYDYNDKRYSHRIILGIYTYDKTIFIRCGYETRPHLQSDKEIKKV